MRQTVKHNVIDRDKILVPPNWDSWGKIRVLREGFDVESISNGWSIDTQLPARPSPVQASSTDSSAVSSATRSTHPFNRPPSPNVPGSVLPTYEQTIPNPYKDRPSTFPPIGEVPLETTVPSMQEFLKSAQEEMIRLAEAEEKASSSVAPQPQLPSTTTTSTSEFSTPTRPSSSSTTIHTATAEGNKVNEHIGPVQFNMGGIQVDADEMVKHLKEKGDKEKKGGYGPGTPEGTKKQNEELAQFFADLMEKGRGKGSPRVGGGRRDGASGEERVGTPKRGTGANGGGG